MQKTIISERAHVLRKTVINERYFKLKVRVSKSAFNHASPGHFAYVLCSQEITGRKNRTFEDYKELKNYLRSDSDSILQSQLILRRPLCIHDAYMRKEKGKEQYIFEFLVRKKRSGTALLAKLDKGDTLELLAPIGRPYGYERSVKEKRDVIIAAGGMGIAPLVFLCRKLGENGILPVIFFGFEEAFALNQGSSMDDDLKALSKSFTITSNTIIEDEYEKGFVTDTLAKHLRGLAPKAVKNTDIYACGPYLMLKEVAKIADEFGINCEISLEERMGCGIGACMACVCKMKNNDGFKYKRVCIDGPVFNSKEILFE